MISIIDIQSADYSATSPQPVRAALIADTVSDLPAPTGITGYQLTQGSTCIVIADSAFYRMQSGGTWVQQLQDVTADTYTRAQIDAYIAALQTQITTISTALVDVVDSGAKNLADPYAACGYSGQGSQYPIETGGVKYTLNQDGTITATQQASATTTLKIPVTLVVGETYHISGCPAGGASNTYRVDLRKKLTTTVVAYDYGTGTDFTPDQTDYDLCIRYQNQYTAAQTYAPMICKKSLWTISPAFTQYAPTNAQLYALYRSLL